VLFYPESLVRLYHSMNKLFFLTAFKDDNISVGIVRVRFKRGPSPESRENIQLAKGLNHFHPVSLYEIRKRVNFQSIY